jgi:hypothetical protein
MEKTTGELAASKDEATKQASLRMLYLAAGRREDALRPMTGLSTAEQEYWTEQLYALATYLDTRNTGDAQQRAAKAGLHLAKAASRLSEMAPLLVRNLAFCTEVQSYGVFSRFAKNEFKPGQLVLLYAEIENFRSEESQQGFHTAIKSSYQILDRQGRRVANGDFALTEEHCQNQRRDYFVRYFFSMPDRIYNGDYVLELTTDDTLGHKIGQSTIDFRIVEE